MLTKKKINYFYRLLNKKAEDLLERIDHPVSDLTGGGVDNSPGSLDFTDQATLESDLDLNIHIKERDSKLIIKIKEALERLENGSYGICEECGKKISESRLKARPVTTMCITCKRKQEAEEKLRGL